jgi:hypothetical protein
MEGLHVAKNTASVHFIAIILNKMQMHAVGDLQCGQMGNEKYNAVKCHAWGRLRQEARITPSLSPHPPPLY